MPIRQSRRTQARKSVRGRSGVRRPAGERCRAWRGWSAVLLALALLAAALFAPATQARRPKAELPKEVEGTWADGAATVTCRQVHWTFKNLPDGSKGTVSVAEVLRIDGSTHRTTFSFVGPAGAQTTTIDAPVGPNGTTATARWKAGKLGGHLVVHAKLTCGSELSLSVEKLQDIAGSGGLPTTSSLTGLVGQTVDYEVLVMNTGNVPLTLDGFTDLHCDDGTLSGGPGEAALAPEASTTYTCTHLLDVADQSAGSYSDTAEVTGTPPEGDGAPITDTSNAVVMKVAPTSTPSQRPREETHEQGTTSTDPATGPPTPLADSGVLGFTAAGVTSSNAPQGCVRSSLRVNIRSAGVASVTFYLDGRRLKTLTWRNARKGLLTLEINSAKLKVGAHKLVIRITMAHGASKKATVASRTVRILRCHSAVVNPNFTG
jgi:hypothetical protein